MLSFIVFLIIHALLNAQDSECIREYANVTECPTWTYPNKSSSQHECVCGDIIKGAVNCNPVTLDVSISPYYCMSYDENMNTTIVANCPYRPPEYEYSFMQVPKEPSVISSFLCGSYHRRGRLCGECKENYSLSLYSYNLGCIKCDTSQYNWIKFVAAVFFH